MVLHGEFSQGDEMKPWKFRIAPQFIVIGVLIAHGVILFQNCSSSNMKIDYLEESSASIQGIAEIKFEAPKAAYGPSTTEIKFSVDKTYSPDIKSYSCQWEGSSAFDCSSKVLIISALPDGDQKLKLKLSYDSGQTEEVYALIRTFADVSNLGLIQEVRLPS